MDEEKVSKAATPALARQYAIDWQHWSSEQALSYGELAAWQGIFSTLAAKFGLVEEFKENGII